MPDLDRYTCEEAFRRLDDYLDGELTPRETALVREHLEVCAMCAEEFGFEASVLREVRDRVQRIEAPPDLMSRLMNALDHPPQDPEASPDPDPSC